AFPVSIGAVSRLRSRGERQKTLAAAAAGSIDILIGTHALVQPGVLFKNLGLAIIDEEQRFGVDHKERLKMLQTSVDVLTLSATPIPRTLYMSMTGARDMSLLQTPPQERLEIETRVERDSDAAIRAAVVRELARGGQVFFLHNRVMTIDLIYDRLRSLVPEARVAVAHGQMKAAELADAMRRFESGECDVLLSTSIIESGLDIPRANTIIIHRADRFGLAELYQLRGRVGRSSRRGYALLLIPEQGIIDGDARERIAAIRRHGGLSGGLGLALRDLEIRGAGNLLGAEQSGHIASVGFGLYCQLLKRTVARLKGEKPPEIIDVDLLLDFIQVADADGAGGSGAACIPASYIEDEPIRMGFYRRLAEAMEVGEVRALAEELRERFGTPPQEARLMLRIAELRIVAAKKGIRRIEVKDGVIRPYDRHGRVVTGPGGRFARVRGATPDAKLTTVFHALSR
ncbi:MAG: transcription-repair coupling factor, partial [Kiritimatiellae bacterium]|nr:transcription-repair coupling factor [Kiritimatiellia bacterium]